MEKYLACTLKGESRAFLAYLPQKYAFLYRKDVYLKINEKWNGPFAILNIFKDLKNPNLPLFKSDYVKLEINNYFRLWEEDKQRWCTEHKAKVERYLERELPSGLTIHHIDGNRYNNELYNFYICNREEHDAIEAGRISKPKKSNLLEWKRSSIAVEV